MVIFSGDKTEKATPVFIVRKERVARSSIFWRLLGPALRAKRLNGIRALVLVICLATLPFRPAARRWSFLRTKRTTKRILNLGTDWVQLRGKNWLCLSRKRRQTKPLVFLICYFGTRRSKVQILSPRPLQNPALHRFRLPLQFQQRLRFVDQRVPTQSPARCVQPRSGGMQHPL